MSALSFDAKIMGFVQPIWGLYHLTNYFKKSSHFQMFLQLTSATLLPMLFYEN